MDKSLVIDGICNFRTFGRFTYFHVPVYVGHCFKGHLSLTFASDQTTQEKRINIRNYCLFKCLPSFEILHVEICFKPTNNVTKQTNSNRLHQYKNK